MNFLLVLALLNIVFDESHGAVLEELYWKSVFPNNPMPKALKDILPPPGSLSDHLQRTHANRQSIKDIINGPEQFYGYKDPSKEFNGPQQFYGYKDPSKELNGPEQFYGYKDPSKEFNGPQQFYGYKDPSKEFNVPNSLSGNPPGNHGNVQLIKEKETIFFFEKDLHHGNLVNLPGLITTSDKTPFLPDRVVKSIPFSSAELLIVLNHFSLKPHTREADNVNKTIRGCERVAIDGEQKFCATSLESFIDLSISKLGKQIKLLSTELSKETKNPLFTIASGMQNMGENQIVCHKMEYPGAVFLCHSINKTTVYKVPLISKDATKANALAVCHRDTLAWNPKHIAFEILKVKPGTVPICHFLTRDTLVWVSN